ncbi:MAG TPA: hypothetical protein DCQ06_13170 [Myxococcales bacterium]|nr:hypothetical protein [Myxococcales bacterium]
MSNGNHRRIWIHRSLALLLCAAGVWMLWSRWQRGAHSPSEQSLERAAQIIDAEFRHGDAIAFAPEWLATDRWRFESLWRDHDSSLTKAWVPSALEDRWELADFSRLWLLSAYDESSESYPHLSLAVRDEPLGSNMRLRLFEMPKEQILFAFGQHLDQAKMVRIGPKAGQQIRCRVLGSRQSCGPKWWHDVYVKMQQVAGSRRRCIFVQPHPDGAVVKMTWKDLPAAQRLEGRLGNRLWAVRHPEGSPVHFRVRVGRTLRHEQTLAIDDVRWHRWQINLSPQERTQPVTFEFSAKEVAWRQLCFDVRLMGAAKPGPSAAGTPQARQSP